MTISNQPLDAAVDIVEGATISYWLGKAVKGDIDPLDSQGRIVPTVNVRNHAEYATVAAGQVSAGHLLWPLFIHCLVLPFLAFTGIGVLAATAGSYQLGLSITHHVQSANQWGAITFMVLAPLWVYVVLWRITIKGGFKWLFKHGPKIHYADGYRGPFNAS